MSMKVNLFIIAFFGILYFSLNVQAREESFDLTSEYGPKLDKVSFKERYLFQKTMGKDWYQSTLSQRQQFLQDYHDDLIRQTKAKEELQKRKEHDQKSLSRKKELEQHKI